MNREALFRRKRSARRGMYRRRVFYGISGIVFLMILTGIPAAPFLALPRRRRWNRGFGVSGSGGGIRFSVNACA
ncbi:MAG: hypothetical protein ACLR8P_22980 [Clostridium fessum]